MVSDADLDASVRRVLNDLLQQGDPYTSLPLLDPTAKVFPPSVMGVFDGLYKEPTDELAEVVAEQGTDLEEVATTVNVGRLSEPELNATFVGFDHGAGVYRVVNGIPRPDVFAAADWNTPAWGTGGAGVASIEEGAGWGGADARVLTWTVESTATGTNTGPNLSPSTDNATPVAPGDSFAGSIWAEVAGTPGDVVVQSLIMWFTSANVFISQTDGGLTTLPKAKPTRVYTPVGVAPATAAKAVPVVRLWTASQMGVGTIRVSAPQGEVSAVAGPTRDSRYADTEGGEVTIGPNLIPTVDGFDATGWNTAAWGTGGAGTASIEADGGPEGRTARVLDWTTASTQTGTNTGPNTGPSAANSAPVTPGDTYSGVLAVSVTGAVEPLEVQALIIWLDGAGAFLSQSTASTTVTIPNDGTYVDVETPEFVAPASAAKGAAYVRVWTAADMGTGVLRASYPRFNKITAAAPRVSLIARTERVAAFGDSHFGQADGGGYILPVYLQEILGMEVFPAGRGGEPSTGIAARAGVIDLAVTVTGSSIPASGTVAATVSPSSTYRMTGSWPIPGTLAGVPGNLSLVEGAWQFTRYATGSVTACPAGTVFVPWNVPRSADVWLWGGGNNLPNTTTAIRDLDAFVAACEAAGRKYLILSIYNDTSEPSGSAGYVTKQTINAHAAARYPGAYLDTRRYVIDHGLSLLGITPTVGDTTAIGQDRIPPSLLADTTHLKPEARRLVAALIAHTLRRRGMVA